MRNPKCICAAASLLGVFLMPGALLAQTDGGSDPSIEKGGTKCPKIEVSSVERGLTESHGRFSTADTTDLVFNLLFHEALREEHVVTLDVYTPNGHLYRRLGVPVAPAGEKALGRERRLPGYPHPVTVRTPRTTTLKSSRYSVVEVLFPVAGTAIVTSSLFGRWQIEVFLDGGPKPCRGGRTTFIITE